MPSFKRLLFFLFFFVFAKATLPRGVRKRDAAIYSGAGGTFKCRDGSKTIPFSQVNDDYCDCADGSDEPGTSACPNGTFHCLNKGHVSLTIPSSRVFDGICDCCDGSDEQDGRCPNTCAEFGKQAQLETLQRIAAMEQGATIREKLVSEARVLKETRQNELDQILLKIAQLDAQIELAKEKKDTEEAVEQEEQQRREQEAQDAAAAASPPPASNPQGSTPEATSTQSAPSATSQEPTPTTPAQNSEPAGEDKEKPLFPYPAEYAPPPAGSTTDTDDEETSDEEDKSDDEMPKTPPTTSPPAAPAYVSPAAEEARAELKKLESERSDYDKKANDIKTLLGHDYGASGEFMSLQGSCFDFSLRQYTYVICPYDRAEQKEGHSSTSLGKWKGWETEKDEKVMTFKDGQTCWQGPARSLSVSLECGTENKILSVEEPAKCVYAAKMATPVVCSVEHAHALRLNLGADNDLDEH